MKSQILARAVVFDDNGRVLLMRRSSTDDNRPSEQDFPGGGVDAGEEITAGIAREIIEETGLVVPTEDLVLFYTKTEVKNDENLIRLLFFCHVSNQQVRLSDEHDEFHWVTPEQAIVEFPHPFYSAGLEYGLKHKLFSFLAEA